MNRLLLIALFLVLSSDAFAFQTRTVKVQAIECTTKGEKEYCTSEDKRALNGRIAVQSSEGNVSSISEFKDGYRDGESLFYDNEGRLTSKVIFQKGLKDGISYYYHANGEIWIAAPYVKGLLHGTSNIYDAKGKERGRFKYDRGELDNGYCNHKGQKIRYPNSRSKVEFNQLVTCGGK